MKPKGHQPQHGTHYHLSMKPSPKRSGVAFRHNNAAARGSGQRVMPSPPPAPPQMMPPGGPAPLPPEQGPPRPY